MQKIPPARIPPRSVAMIFMSKRNAVDARGYGWRRE
jgi:hypothetical protein